MELEDLKTSWSVLNERLAQNEILNKRIIKEMITNRTQSAYKRLFRYDFFGLILLTVACIVLPILQSIGQLGVQPLSFALLEGILIIGLLTQIYLFSILIQFDMEKRKLCELSKLALRYQLWEKRGYTYGTALAMVVLIAFCLIQRVYLVQGIVFRLSLLLLLIVFAVCFEVYFYKNHIRTIEKGLKELAEFEKE